MNIYENIMESTGAKRTKVDATGVLKQFLTILGEIENKSISMYRFATEIEEKMNQTDHSAAYKKEYIETEVKKMDQRFSDMFDSAVESARSQVKSMKDRALLTTGDKVISNNNIAKLQSILLNMTSEDKELLFKSAIDKDPNVLEVLYFNTKETDPTLAAQIMDALDAYTGQSEIDVVERQMVSLEGLKSYLNYNYVKAMGEAYQEIDGCTTVIGGTIMRTIAAFTQSIQTDIANIERKSRN